MNLDVSFGAIDVPYANQPRIDRQYQTGPRECGLSSRICPVKPLLAGCRKAERDVHDCYNWNSTPRRNRRSISPLLYGSDGRSDKLGRTADQINGPNSPVS